jgi:hypothetical protein
MSASTPSSGPKPMTMASLVGLVLVVAVCGVGCDEIGDRGGRDEIGDWGGDPNQWPNYSWDDYAREIGYLSALAPSYTSAGTGRVGASARIAAR